MSASVNARPGGQPSTTQPIAGPWLSPKVVTVNSRPYVSPAICPAPLARPGPFARCVSRRCAHDARLARAKEFPDFGRSRYQHAVAAALELERDERQLRVSGRKRVGARAELEEQHTVVREPIARAAQ